METVSHNQLRDPLHTVHPNTQRRVVLRTDSNKRDDEKKVSKRDYIGLYVYTGSEVKLEEDEVLSYLTAYIAARPFTLSAYCVKGPTARAGLQR